MKERFVCVVWRLMKVWLPSLSPGAHSQSAHLWNGHVWQFICPPSHCTGGHVQAAKRLFILEGCYKELELQLVCVSSSHVHAQLSSSLRCKVGGGLDCVRQDGYVGMHNRPPLRAPCLFTEGIWQRGTPRNTTLPLTSAIGGRPDGQRRACLHTRVGGETGLLGDSHVWTASYTT